MAAVLAVVLAALFGAGDQYLGSRAGHPWMTDVSLSPIPWLVLPFVAGCTQRDPGRAALLGLGCTFAALIGYGAMTLSPIENAQMNATTIAGFLRSEAPVFIAGTVTGPVLGWLGQRWRRAQQRRAAAG